MNLKEDDMNSFKVPTSSSIVSNSIDIHSKNDRINDRLKSEHGLKVIGSIDSIKTTPTKTFSSIQTFLIVMIFYTLLFVALDQYITAITTTVQKRFGFTSKAIGIMISVKNISYIFSTIIVSHYFKDSNRPRIIGVMGIIGVFAGFINAIPALSYFFPKRSHLIKMHVTGLPDKSIYCKSNLENKTDISNNDIMTQNLFGAELVFNVASLLYGICQGCIYSLTSTCVDDYSPPSKSASYLGVIYAMRPLGPLISFGVGAFAAFYPEDFKYTDITPENPSWIGAWWIGYVILPILFLIPSILLIFFTEKNFDGQICVPSPTNKFQTRNWKPSLSQDSSYSQYEGVSGLCVSVIRLMHNGIFITFTLSVCCGSFFISGMFPFLPKYLEIQFRLTTHRVSVYLGVMSLLLSLGIVIGAKIHSTMKLQKYQTGLFILFVNIIFMISLGFLMVIECKRPIFIGRHYLNKDYQHSCALNCHCEEIYKPVCALNQTFLSPCYAGCDNITLSGCSCTPKDAILTDGECNSQCFWMWHWLYIMVLFIGSFFAVMGVVPGFMLVLRCVSVDDRSLAIGIFGGAVALLSYIPGPIAFGYVIDSTCLLRLDGICYVYDQDKFKVLMHGTMVTLFGVANIFSAIGVYFLWIRRNVKNSKKRHDSNDIHSPIESTDLTFVSNKSNPADESNNTIESSLGAL